MKYLCSDLSQSYECFQTPRHGRGSTSGSFFYFFIYIIETQRTEALVFNTYLDKFYN